MPTKCGGSRLSSRAQTVCQRYCCQQAAGLAALPVWLMVRHCMLCVRETTSSCELGESARGFWPLSDRARCRLRTPCAPPHAVRLKFKVKVSVEYPIRPPQFRLQLTGELAEADPELRALLQVQC